MYDLWQGLSDAQQSPNSRGRPYRGPSVRVRSLPSEIQEIDGAKDAQTDAHGRETIRVRHLQASFPPEMRTQTPHIGALWCVSSCEYSHKLLYDLV